MQGSNAIVLSCVNSSQHMAHFASTKILGCLSDVSIFDSKDDEFNYLEENVLQHKSLKCWKITFW